MWSIPEITPEFEDRMTDVLAQYEASYDPKEPRINIDEKLYQLTSTPRGIRPARPGKSGKSGKPRREDYEYKRWGTANLFVCIEPKVGRRQIRVTDRRTAKDFAKYIRYLVTVAYKDADKIHLTIDNLNTHKNESFVGQYGEEEGRRIASRIEWHYTPKHASWLNAAEIEISILTDKVLKRRVPTKSELKKETRAYQVRRNKSKSTIDWKFTTEDAKNNILNIHRN